MNWRGLILPSVDIDVPSAYSAAMTLSGCPELLCADDVREVGCPDELRALAEQVAIGDLSPLFDRRTYPFLVSRAGVRFDGQFGPASLRGARGEASRFRVARLRAVSLPVTGADVVLSALLSNRSPEVVAAHRLEAIGRQRVRNVPLYDGLVVPPAEVAAGVRLRLELKDNGDTRLPVQLRVFLNAMWGVFARLDQHRVSHGPDRRSWLVEEPAMWTWPPIAAVVPAICRLWLAMVERLVTDRRSAISSRDTDGCTVLSSPRGGTFALPDGRIVRVLPWPELDELLAPFDLLNPFDDGRPFWKVERGSEQRPLNVLSLAPKRYVLLQRMGGSWEVVGGTEHALSAVPPPVMPGRDADRRHLFTFPIASYAVARAEAISEGRLDPGFNAPWDGLEAAPFPSLHKFSAGSPAVLDELPPALGAHPFSPLVQAQRDRFDVDPDGPAPMALDPGTNLAEWSDLDWRDRHGCLRVTTVPHGLGRGVVLIRPLADVAERWAVPQPPEDPGLVEVDPRLIRRVGRGGALVDAQLADNEARPEDHVVVYDAGDPAAFVADEVRRLGPTAFAARYDVPLPTAKQISAGRPPAPSTIRQVLDALGRTDSEPICERCGQPRGPRTQKYCCEKCAKAARDAAYRRRRRAAGGAAPSGDPSDDSACPSCGVILLSSKARSLHECPKEAI